MTKKKYPVAEQTLPEESKEDIRVVDQVQTEETTDDADGISNEKTLKWALDTFASHPSAQELYHTSDGSLFLEPQFARMHAGTLKDQTILTLKRPQ